MNLNIFYGILIPFLGTSIGAACVFFMKNTQAAPMDVPRKGIKIP